VSYKFKILSDYPLAFWPAESVVSGGVLTFQQLLSNYANYTATLNGFDNYAELSGATIEDISGSQNNGIYLGTIYSGFLPLVSGFSQSRKLSGVSTIIYPVLNDYSGTNLSAGFANLNSYDNDFSIECWVNINTTSTSLIPIVGDPTNDIGLFYDKGNIVFKLDTQQISWTIPYKRKSMHIVATYTGQNAYLFIDGELQAEKSLSGNVFTNTEVVLTSGPVNTSQDYMLINCVALYRYALSAENIQSHYDLGHSIDSSEIVYPDSGQLFEAFDDAITTKYSYSYPADKSWENFLSNDLFYDTEDLSIKIAQGTGVSKTVTINDFFTIPTGPEMDSSRIEWDGDNGVSVLTSIDGTNYVSCINGQPVPQYSLSSFSTSRNLYIRIIMTTTDNSKYLPKLSGLSISFYNNQRFYSNNSSSYISTLEGVSGVSVKDIGLSNNTYEILSRDARNGVSVKAGSGFKLSTTMLVKTLEFFYTPSTLGNGGIINSAAGSGYSASNLSWSSNVIAKTNISKIYVNGVDKSTETDINNLFTKDHLYHVVITFTNPISGDIKINHSSVGAIEALYQNIAIYDYELTLNKSIEHLSLYKGTSPQVVSNSLASMTENSFNYYNYDWTVVESI
jgi:hypothetical protein